MMAKRDSLNEQWTHLIRIYKDIIIPILRPFELLMSGNFNDIIPREIEREIGKYDRDGEQDKAAAIFIEALLKSDADNKWSIFEEEIKMEDHRYIHDIMFGDFVDVDIHQLYKAAIERVFRGKLIQKLDSFGTSDRCYAKGLITKQEYEKVLKVTENHGNSHGNVILLSFIHRKRNWYFIFLKIIWKMNQKELVNHIDPDYFQKLELQDKERMPEDTREAVMFCQGSSSANLFKAPEMDREKAEKPMLDEMNNLDETDLKQSQFQSNSEMDREKAEKPMLDKLNLDETDLKQSQFLNNSDLDDESNIAEDLMLPEPDKIVVRDRPFTLRSYQKELAKSACQGKNVIICAPTGSGKTHVAIQIIKEHMESVKGRNSKVVFLVNQKALAEQQLKVLKDHLGGSHKCIQVSGDTELSVPLEKIVQTNDILVVTAQILVDALKNGDVKSIRIFSLLVFDECHHTKDKHPFNFIMLKYIREKFVDPQNPNDIDMPQVVGLTASVGVGKAKSEIDAVKHIRQLSANLDAVEISTVENNKKELSSHSNTADHAILSCQSREEDEFKSLMEVIMKKIEDDMYQLCEKANRTDLTLQTPNLMRRSSQAYSQWTSKLFKEIARIKESDLRRALESARRYLEICYNSLTVNEDCRTEDALQYLLEKIKSVEQDQGETFTSFEIKLHELFEKHNPVLQKANRGTDSKNPKLNILHDLIRECFKENSDSRAIVFVKTRELANALERWIRETQDIKGLNPRKMVGAGASAERGGMTQSQQTDVMTCFRDGKHKIIVATSVAQEGLDVTKCNMVIQYDYNTNEIAMVQARGRARADNSQYTVIASKESSVGEKEQINLLREKLMNDAIQSLKSQMENNPQDYEQMKRDHQLGKLSTWKLQEDLRQKDLKEGEFKFTCARCDYLACFSSDIRTIKNSQHVVIDPEFENQIKVKVHPRPSTYIGLEKKGKLQCKNCSDDWGNVVKYRDHFYPVIKIEKFCVIDSFSSSKTYKHWKDINFRIDSFNINESESIYNIDSLCDCLLEQ